MFERLRTWWRREQDRRKALKAALAVRRFIVDRLKEERDGIACRFPQVKHSTKALRDGDRHYKWFLTDGWRIDYFECVTFARVGVVLNGTPVVTYLDAGLNRPSVFGMQDIFVKLKHYNELRTIFH